MKLFFELGNKKSSRTNLDMQTNFQKLSPRKTAVFPLVFFLVLLTSLSSCNKLDEDGGYYDEKSQTYKYVRIAKRGVQKSSLQVVSPTPGKTQQVYGTLSRIENDAKSIWLKIEDRNPYMIIAERLSGGNRDDKNKLIKIQLKYVSPMGSVIRKGEFKSKWRSLVLQQLENQLLNQQVLVDIEYEEQARKLWGTVFIVVKTANGDRARNVNLWMIRQGLSYYFIEKGAAENDKNYRDAQNLARKSKIGIWRYQS